MMKRMHLMVMVLVVAVTGQGAFAFEGKPLDQLPPEEARQMYQKLVSQRQELIDESNKVRGELAAIQKQLNSDNRKTWMDPSLQPKRNELAGQVLMLQVELAGLEAKQAAIEKAVNQQQKETQQEADSDEIARQLKELVTLREAELTSAKAAYEEGTRSLSDVQNTEGALIESRIKLAQRRETLAGQILSPAALRFRDQLIELTASISETQAKLKAVQQQGERADLLVQEAALTAKEQWGEYSVSVAYFDDKITQLIDHNPAATQPATTQPSR